MIKISFQTKYRVWKKEVSRITPKFLAWPTEKTEFTYTEMKKALARVSMEGRSELMFWTLQT